MTTLSNLSTAQLKRAVQLREELDGLYSDLNQILTGSGPSPTRGRRTMSAEARRKIAEAQRARWAKQKGIRRKMNPAARAKIAAAAKARWAKAKAAGKNRL